MYLHIGNNYLVRLSDVVGIFDIENTTVDKCTKKFLERAEREKHCIYTTLEMPKSFVVTVRNGEEKVYISQLAAGTLKKRLAEGIDS